MTRCNVCHRWYVAGNRPPLACSRCAPRAARTPFLVRLLVAVGIIWLAAAMIRQGL